MKKDEEFIIFESLLFIVPTSAFRVSDILTSGS